jgi:putative transposase
MRARNDRIMERSRLNHPPGGYWHKNIRRAAEHYVGQRRYFITLCCPLRRPLLRDASVARLVVEMLRDVSFEYRFAVYVYCVMPNHLHALVIGLDRSSNMMNVVEHFKKVTNEFHRKLRGSDLWQKKFYDRILRDSDPNGDVANYIWMNPVRQDLCVKPEDWEFSGSFKNDHPGYVYVDTDWKPPWRR